MATHIRRSTSVWNGSGKEGSGKITSTSGALKDTPYSASARFVSEDGRAGTNPEELIAAAHSSCFSMALAFQLSNAGLTADHLTATANVALEKRDDGWEVTGIVLELTGRVPGASDAQFQELASKAAKGCPMSKLLKSVPIELKATLEG